MKKPPPVSPNHLPEAVGRKAERKRRARAAGQPSVWFGLGLFGIAPPPGNG